MSFKMVWFALTAFCLCACTATEPVVTQESFRSASYHEYMVYSWNEALRLDWVTERPDQQDQAIHFCVPAAFTRAGDFAIDGAYIENGGCQHFDAVNQRLGGGLHINIKGEPEFIDTQKGALLTEDFCDQHQQKGADFFQQIMMVVDGQPAVFKDKALFTRRALVQKADGSLLFLESVKAASMTQFAMDLVEFGAQQAIYLDMGSFDEGWWRYAGEPLSIGRSKTQTELQTNWLVLRAN